MILTGTFSKNLFKLIIKRHEEGEGCNLFEFCSNDKMVVGKLFKYGISKNSLNIYLMLKDPNHTEIFIDYSIVNRNETKLYFGFFSKIYYKSSNIPNIFNETEALKSIYKSLEYIHKKNILHNDINPSNIMCNYKNVLLIDFEFAIDMNNFKYLNDSLLHYTHPKVIANEEYFWKNIDYWASICSIYEIFYNKYLCQETESNIFTQELKKYL